MRMKYIYQQFISHISVIIVAFLVLSLLFAYYVETQVYQNKVEELEQYGGHIWKDMQLNQFRQRDVLLQYYNVLDGRKIHFVIFDENGRLLPILPVGKFPKIDTTAEEWERIWKQIKNGQTVVIRQDIRRFDQEVTFVAMPYVSDGEFVGGIFLFSPISGSREMISEINKFLFYTVIIALSVSLLLSWLLSRIHVNRIKKIQEAASLVSSGDFTVHVPASDFDEIGELANDFNHMVVKLHSSMEEIESLENRRRQFMSDVSHELRTPLTTISGVIEGLRNNMIPEEEKEKGMRLVSHETKRLIRLVNENLDYDKIRSNQITLNKENIQVMEVLEIIKEQLFLQAEDQRTKLIVEVDENIIVYADYDRLVQILINITKNSIQFTKNGTIWLRGMASYKETIIEIEDTGIGIEPKEIENIWKRFYKADISRTSNPYGEFGLGLSIVKKLVQLHNGEIEVTSQKEQGTKFVIRFPFPTSLHTYE
ncbi:HAMP domain-containing sensor histidine kinase [Bacillus sp. 03113]|uniref:HAMP domain-containing sensor histidine kinase n=1 Tax=Bacillus sp. 03113 TaxID=2578211 RepID=UPI0011443189|nr:HAMP domain-containing sensor histidine kinase [Bacillus sp. 03113]